MLVATDAGHRGEGRRGSQAGAGARGVRALVVLGEQSRFVIEVGDDALNVFNILQIVNTAKRPVQTDGPLVFELPASAVGAGMLEGSTPNAVAAGRQGDGHRPVRARQHASCSSPIRCRSAARRSSLAQKMPAQMTQVAVVAQKIGAMQLSSPQIDASSARWRRTARPTSSARAGAVKAGDTLTLTLTGLPHRADVAAATSRWCSPRLILAAGAWGATRGRTAPTQDARRAAAATRDRDKLFAELAALEAQRRQGDDRRARLRRRGARDLVTALEDLYAELEREVA